MNTDAATLEAELRSYGISVEQLSVDDGEIDLEYMTAFPADRVHDGEIGRACNTLIDMIEADECEPMRVDATVVRSPGDVLGHWHAEAEWFEQLTNYAISETEFSTRVLETVRHETDGGEGATNDEPVDGTESP
ncbi:hypothetical protein [Haloparvum sp. PAK95]|uniref:hypothetical protein n=1 Tax=Haloparvum sp. PAK95 TaxID=3418962 RepID=UPI003D2EBA65